MWNEFTAARERQKQTLQRDLALAWHIEALHRQERLMPLSRLLGVKATQASVADKVADHRAALMTLSHMTGIPLKPGKAKTT